MAATVFFHWDAATNQAVLMKPTGPNGPVFFVMTPQEALLAYERLADHFGHPAPSSAAAAPSFVTLDETVDPGIREDDAPFNEKGRETVQRPADSGGLDPSVFDAGHEGPAQGDASVHLDPPVIGQAE